MVFRRAQTVNSVCLESGVSCAVERTTGITTGRKSKSKMRGFMSAPSPANTTPVKDASSMLASPVVPDYALTGKAGFGTWFTGAKASAQIPSQCSNFGQTSRLKLTLTRFSGPKPSSHRMLRLM